MHCMQPVEASTVTNMTCWMQSKQIKNNVPRVCVRVRLVARLFFFCQTKNPVGVAIKSKANEEAAEATDCPRSLQQESPDGRAQV